MRYSVFDLAFTYIERFYEEEPPTEEKRRILQEFQDLLAAGWTTEDIIKHLRAFITKHPGVRPDIPRLFSKLHRSQENLMKPDRFYYHNQLRITPGPPKRYLDYNTGQIVKTEEDYYLEMRTSYTIDDLTDYYLEQFTLDVSPEERKRIVGSFKYLLKTHDLDLILFMIDVAANHAHSEDMDRESFNPLKLTDWKTIAREQLNEKITENKLSGDDKIVPRKRVLSLRSRDSIQ